MARRGEAGSDKIRSGNLCAFLVRSSRRTVSLQVNTDLSLVMKAPVDTARALSSATSSSGGVPGVERHLERMERIMATAPSWKDGSRLSLLGESIELRVKAGSPRAGEARRDIVIATARGSAGSGRSSGGGGEGIGQGSRRALPRHAGRLP